MTTTPQHGDPVEVVPAVIDASVARGDTLPLAAHAAVTPTQLRRPRRAVARTVFQATVSLAAMWGLIVATLDLPDWAWVGTSVAVAGGITRVMAIPAVETWLRRFLPFLAAAPAPKGS